MMNIINTYYTFFGCNYDIFLQFCLILGWRKSIISILSETSSNKTPTPLNVPETFLRTKSINESSLSHACPRALKIYSFPWRSGNKSIPFSLIPPKFSTLFLNARLAILPSPSTAAWEGCLLWLQWMIPLEFRNHSVYGSAFCIWNCANVGILRTQIAALRQSKEHLFCKINKNSMNV